LRSRLRARASEESRRRPRTQERGATRASRAGPPGSEGRWSLRSARWAATPGDTERRAALAHVLLDRYGIVAREAVHAEQIAGGFSAVYDVLKAMEEAGRVRRGYFVAGRGGAQFALPGADERLRALREAEEPAVTRVLAATDPANPFGATLDWPAPATSATSPAARPQRSAGALVVLRDGALLGWLGRSEQALLTFLAPEEPARAGAQARALAEALAQLVDGTGRRALLLSTIDGEPARTSPLAAAFLAAGFSTGGSGLLKRRAA